MRRINLINLFCLNFIIDLQLKNFNLKMEEVDKKFSTGLSEIQRQHSKLKVRIQNNYFCLSTVSTNFFAEKCKIWFSKMPKVGCYKGIVLNLILGGKLKLMKYTSVKWSIVYMLLPAFTGDCDRSDIHNWQPINYYFVFVLNSSSVASFQSGILLNFGLC